MSTTTIRQADLIESVAAALQYISYYHPADYIAHLARAYAREQSPAAKDAIAQILTNSKMSATGHRPICQDTGIVNVFVKIGMDVRLEGFNGTLEDAINEGVRRGYTNPDNMLRASVVGDPEFERKNTKDNTPAVIFTELVPGDTLEVTVAAKGGGRVDGRVLRAPRAGCRRAREHVAVGPLRIVAAGGLGVARQRAAEGSRRVQRPRRRHDAAVHVSGRGRVDGVTAIVPGEAGDVEAVDVARGTRDERGGAARD
jgi:hypothetical protein